MQSKSQSEASGESRSAQTINVNSGIVHHIPNNDYYSYNHADVIIIVVITIIQVSFLCTQPFTTPYNCRFYYRR